MIRRDYRPVPAMALAALALTSLTALAKSPAGSGEATSDEISAPPGLVEVKGGRVAVGADEEFILELIEQNIEIRNPLVAEMGGKSVRLDDFFLMPSEVTNEQFAVFLRATGSSFRPPNTWLDQTEMIAARDEYLRTENEKKAAQRAEGKRYEVQPFNTESWFDRNWENLDWSVPEGEEAMPVTFVDHNDARQYAEWAGLRLMTEFEFQGAVRGNDQERQWPWGDEWDPSKCVSRSKYDSRVQPVGTTKYATESGLHDLIGNVWEWTDSPYVGYEDYEDLNVAFGRSKDKTFCAAEFNADERVAVGGSVDYDMLANRATVRRGMPRFSRNAKLGFRCAATGIGGQDLMRGIGRTARGFLRPKTPIDPERAVALHHWATSEGTAKVDGYQVIEAYDYVAIASVEQLEERSMAAIGVQSRKEGPVDVGLLTTSVPLVEPPLPPGTYRLSWRDKGPDQRETEEDEDGEEAAEVTYPYDLNEVNFLMTDVEGNVVAIFDGSDADTVNPDKESPNGKLELIPYVAPKSAKKAAEETPLDSIDVTLDVPTKGKKVARFVFGLRLAAGTIDNSWIGVGE
ncbi:MAG: SUMF1/EgtB/PvdO family nonheme iron enzyme [Planctomycetota bacterium]